MGYNLDRFLKAQEHTYESAKKELINGIKKTHWMWFIFPQIRGLGFSELSYYYGIENLEEAEEYNNHPILGARLIELCNILLSLDIKDPVQIFGEIDAKKLQSSMTLFYKAGNNQIFRDVLRKYYFGEFDQNTMKLLENK